MAYPKEKTARRFNGQVFQLAGYFAAKYEAVSSASYLRRMLGYKVRTVKSSHAQFPYANYVRK